MGNYAGWSSQAGFVQPGASAALSTIWDLPWIDQPTLALADGNNTIDGATWTGANAAAATTFEITNTQGLRITAASGISRTWTTAAATAPSVRVNLSALTTIDWSRDLWVWTRMSDYNLPVTNNYVAGGLYAAATGSYSATMIANGWSNASGPFTQPTYQRNATIYANATQSATPPTDQIGDVSVIKYTADGQAISYIGTWSNGWPDPSSLIVTAKDGQPESSAVVTLALLASRANTQLVYTAMTRAGTGAPAMTISHSRIQQ